MADDDRLLASTLDPDGRRVELAEERWTHVVAGHPELGAHLAAVVRAVREPDRHMAGRRADEEWFYLEGAGPSRWLKVVVHYEGDRGRIVTAFARRSIP